jgi:hypothetical protein
MIDGMVQRGLAADALSTLQAVIDEASNAERTTNTGLITEVHTVVADVAVEAYKAGVLATAGALPFYESETDLASQLVFKADCQVPGFLDTLSLTTVNILFSCS